MIKYFLGSGLPISLLLVFSISLLDSCSENKSKEVSSDKGSKQLTQQYDGVTIVVDIFNKNCLSILLANDGTINRKGSSAFDSKDRNFFLGLSNNNAFDSLMSGMPGGLMQYCNAAAPGCDTLKPNCRAKIAFGNNTSLCEIEYCVNGTIDSLPKPIRDFIDKSISVTEPWYQEQLKMLKAR